MARKRGATGPTSDRGVGTRPSPVNFSTVNPSRSDNDLEIDEDRGECEAVAAQVLEGIRSAPAVESRESEERRAIHLDEVVVRAGPDGTETLHGQIGERD